MLNAVCALDLRDLRVLVLTSLMRTEKSGRFTGVIVSPPGDDQ
jgi:hypothetical protein